MYTHARLETEATDAGEVVLLARTGRGPADAEIVARLGGAGSRGRPDHIHANAERLAASWNLCLGIPHNVLAAAAKADLAARLDALTRAVRPAVGTAARAAATKPSAWHG